MLAIWHRTLYSLYNAGPVCIAPFMHNSNSMTNRMPNAPSHGFTPIVKTATANLMAAMSLTDLTICWDIPYVVLASFGAGKTSVLGGLLRSCVLDVPKASSFRYLSAGIKCLNLRYFCACTSITSSLLCLTVRGTSILNFMEASHATTYPETSGSLCGRL